MKIVKRVLLAICLLLVGGAAFIALKPAQPAPPGFISIRKASAFQNEAMLTKAWALPVAAKYPHPLIAQTNPSACGPTSVANLLESSNTHVSSKAVAEHGSGCFNGFCFGGLTLEQLATAARETDSKLKVEVIHPNSLEAFREELKHTNEVQNRYVINFTRFPLFATGGGHHSPIGGYLESEDLVFVLDVNETYKPWLVSSARLFEAMDTIDSSSNQKRGLLKITQAP
jgi:hypothetical protein